ncbi:MAG: hypothetical protein ACLU16_08160, partial [Blautia wexlerae]
SRYDPFYRIMYGQKKNRINSNPSNVLFAHLFRDHGFRLQCSGDMLHGICKDCENKSDQL